MGGGGGGKINWPGQLAPTPETKHMNNATKKTAEIDMNYVHKGYIFSFS